MLVYNVTHIRNVSENLELSTAEIESFIDPEDCRYDPTFPIPFSRNNILFWEMDEIEEWERLQDKLAVLEEHDHIEILR